jgi:glycerophosphoryl diester phosphodiesterase
MRQLRDDGSVSEEHMDTHSTIEVQGHRGARGLLPENTLPSFEIALDLGVASIETDLHLTRDDHVVLFHDSEITERVCSMLSSSGSPAITTKPPVRSLTLEHLRNYRVDCQTNPASMPLAQAFAQQRGIDPYAIPTLIELFDFAQAYAGLPGEQAGKTTRQREGARRLIFDLELKRVPFFPQTIGDGFKSGKPGTLEHCVVDAIRHAGVLDRTRVRSFDHRSVCAFRQLEPALPIGLLIYSTAPAHIGLLLDAAQAVLYCPDYHFVDAEVVRQVHAAGKRILPYTVNEADEWEQLLVMGVDGITTDFPDRLLCWLAERGIATS